MQKVTSSWFFLSTLNYLVILLYRQSARRNQFCATIHAGNSNALNVFIIKSTHITLRSSFSTPNRNTCLLYTDKRTVLFDIIMAPYCVLACHKQHLNTPV